MAPRRHYLGVEVTAISTLLVAFNGTMPFGQKIGDTVVSIKCAWLFAQDVPCSKYLLSLSPHGGLNFLWQKWIDTFNAQVVYDTFHPGDSGARHEAWSRWYKERQIDGLKFDHYRELYRRIDGGHRQAQLCGGEKGLGRKNVFQYMLYGQENEPGPAAVEASLHFKDDLIYHDPLPYTRDVFVAIKSVCQNNEVWTYNKPIPKPYGPGTGAPFWDQVIRKLSAAGVTVTVNSEHPYCDDAQGVERSFVPYAQMLAEVRRHRLVVCGNTGVMWLAAATGTPVLVMQHDESNMQDYRAEWCGLESLVDFVREPDAAYVAGKVVEYLNRKTVLTTGCFDLLHAGHVRHLEESKSYGDRLVVALNSDDSVRQSKGEGRPVRNQKDREEVLRALRCVDDVVVFDGADALPLIHKLRPQVLTNGSDHKLEEIVGREFVEACGGSAVITGGERKVSTTRIIQRITGADIVKACKDAERFSVNPYRKLKFLADQCLLVENVPGALADVGSYRGGCAIVMKAALPEKAVHLFDTWDGMKEADPLCHHKPGEWKADLKDCKAAVGEDERTHFHKGDFPASADGLDVKFALAYVDADTYHSTLDALRWFWERLEKGGRMIGDDWNWPPCQGAEKAWREFFAADQLQEHPEVNAVVVVK